MPVAVEHFEDAPHHLMLALDRLVGIGIGTDGDRARRVAGSRKLALEQFGCVRLGKQLGFEIEPGRKAEIGVGRPREAIDATVLAAAVRIDRAIEADVRRIVARDDLARRVDSHRGPERWQLLERLPAVVEAHARQRLVASGGIRLRAAAAAALPVNRYIAVSRRLEVDGGGASLQWR